MERALLTGAIRELRVCRPQNEPDTPSAMRSFYRSFVRNHRAEWSKLLHKLCEPDAQPVVLHCAGGKDRTGVAIAIVLLALGVPVEAVMRDYLQTNVAVGEWIAIDHPSGLSPYFLSVMKADASYLDAALSDINSEFSGIESYLVNELNFSESQREVLKLAYLD